MEIVTQVLTKIPQNVNATSFVLIYITQCAEQTEKHMAMSVQ